ncbi:MAG TPA: DUF362 domain-containing protein, partial [bacterium (Candidatus Stahlbacteria)]|nr:DUF362 domain-containing protein [Candidatus Stahlbacteria bacterium]
VYFIDLRKKTEEDYLERFCRFLDEKKFLTNIDKKKPTAVKFHPGEAGNIYFVKPQFIRPVYERIGGRAFLTDTTTLYPGPRSLASTYHLLVKEHGFGFAPFIIADGLRGESYEKIEGCEIAKVITVVDQLVVISHFKGHMVTGFGGAIKNLGMGCSAKAGKLKMHSYAKPKIKDDKCQRCNVCVEYCPEGAISEGDPPRIDYNLCIGCCGCLSICPNRAIGIEWNAEDKHTIEKIVTYAQAVLKDKLCLYINFLVDITRNCDCFHTIEPPVGTDIGILAADDPVALDKASYDLTREVISKAQPQTDPLYQIEKAVEVGLGTDQYRLVTV